MTHSADTENELIVQLRMKRRRHIQKLVSTRNLIATNQTARIYQSFSTQYNSKLTYEVIIAHLPVYSVIPPPQRKRERQCRFRWQSGPACNKGSTR